MKRLITALTLLAVIIAMGIFSYRYISRTVDMLAHTVTAARAELQAGSMDAAQQTMAQSYAGWQQREGALRTIMRHNEIDEIERLYQRTLQALELGDTDEGLLTLAELLTLIGRLPQMEQPTLSNVF